MLFLCAARPDFVYSGAFHPDYDCDVIWHTHMVAGPRAYREDTLRLVGRDVIHWPWPHDAQVMEKNRQESIKVLDEVFHTKPSYINDPALPPNYLSGEPKVRETRDSFEQSLVQSFNQRQHKM